MRQVAARVKHPCFGVRVASVHKINRLHLENVACRGEKLLFEKTVFKTFCGEKDDKYMKTPHFRAVFSALHLSSTHLGPRWETRTPDILLPNLCLNLREALLRPLWRFPALLRFLFGTLLPCSFQAPLSSFGICVGLNSVY